MKAEGWLKVLQEVRRQAARVAAAAHVQLPDVDGPWFDVRGAEPAVTTTSVRQAEAWHQQQWLVAFEVLVRLHMLQLACSRGGPPVVFCRHHVPHAVCCNIVASMDMLHADLF